jgi:hypothetical protein
VRYAGHMVVRKITVSLEESAYRAAVESARAAGQSLSAWLSGYAEHRARLEAGLRAVAGYEAEYGPLTGAGASRAEQVLDTLGVGSPVPEELDRQYQAALAALRINPPDVDGGSAAGHGHPDAGTGGPALAG